METTLKIGDMVEAEVTKITAFGAFARINSKQLGLIHISQIADSFVKDITEHLKLGSKVKARIVKLGPGKKIDLSLKKATGLRRQRKTPDSVSTNRPPDRRRSEFKSSDFEEKLDNFLQRVQ